VDKIINLLTFYRYCKEIKWVQACVPLLLINLTSYFLPFLTFYFSRLLTAILIYLLLLFTSLCTQLLRSSDKWPPLKSCYWYLFGFKDKACQTMIHVYNLFGHFDHLTTLHLNNNKKRLNETLFTQLCLASFHQFWCQFNGQLFLIVYAKKKKAEVKYQRWIKR